MKRLRRQQLRRIPGTFYAGAPPVASGRMRHATNGIPAAALRRPRFGG